MPSVGGIPVDTLWGEKGNTMQGVFVKGDGSIPHGRKIRISRRKSVQLSTIQNDPASQIRAEQGLDAFSQESKVALKERPPLLKRSCICWSPDEIKKKLERASKAAPAVPTGEPASANSGQVVGGGDSDTGSDGSEPCKGGADSSEAAEVLEGDFKVAAAGPCSSDVAHDFTTPGRAGLATNFFEAGSTCTPCPVSAPP